MKRKREEHNGCGGGTPGSQKTRRTAPLDAYFVRIRGCCQVVKVISNRRKCGISINILKNYKNFLDFMLDNRTILLYSNTGVEKT